MDPHLLPHINASLNALATMLLFVGYVLIKQRRITAHKWTMLASFVVSTVFLVCYLVYHAQVGSKRFPTDGLPAVRYTYYVILASHVVLAAAVPFLALYTIYLGLKDDRPRHIKWARWTFPIWMYVSVTGVVVYWFLYHLATA